MYILNERIGRIVDSSFIEEFFLTDTPDSTLLSVCWTGKDKPMTLERYKNHKEAMDALGQLFLALSVGRTTLYIPESSYYFEERPMKDTRTKRRGGS